MVKNTNWTPISVEIDLAKSIESFVNSREGKKLGYKSKSGFVADAIKEKLESLTGEPKNKQTRLEEKMIDMNNEIIKTQKLLIEVLENSVLKIEKKSVQDTPRMTKSELTTWKGARVEGAKYLKEQGLKPYDFKKNRLKGVKNKELEKKVTNS